MITDKIGKLFIDYNEELYKKVQQTVSLFYKNKK